MKVFLFLLLVFIFVGLEFDVVQSGTMVTGAVFCDQCKDGQVSMFDYPLSGKIHSSISISTFNINILFQCDEVLRS